MKGDGEWTSSTAKMANCQNGYEQRRDHDGGRISAQVEKTSSDTHLWSSEDRTPTHGYEPTREAAMAAFAKSWRRE
jgi:hypothetical protein